MHMMTVWIIVTVVILQNAQTLVEHDTTLI